MTDYFVPYKRKRPASVNVNGHRVIILSQSRDTVEDALPFCGGDAVRRCDFGDTEFEEAHAFSQLSRKINGGVVIAPPNMQMSEILKDLEGSLPWLQ